MPPQLPPLGALRAFDAAARHASFVRAAAELHVTAAAVSHQIKQLEQWLGITLFSRSANGVTLTAEGREYASNAAQVFAQLQALSARARSRVARPAVVIRGQFSVIDMWLTPRLVGLTKALPHVDVRVVALPDRSDFKVSPDLQLLDVATLRGYTSEPLFCGSFRLYGAPTLANAYRNARPRELLTAPLIHTHYLDQRWKYPSLREWFAAAKVDTPIALPGLQFNLLHLSAAACMHGAGLALLLDEYCIDAVRGNALRALKGPVLASPHTMYLHLKRDASDAAREVHGWLRAQSSVDAA